MNEGKHRQQHRLHRGLARATVEATDARHRKEAELRNMAGGDVGQQVQVPTHGKVGRDPVWQEIDVEFPMPFLNRVSPGDTDTTPDPHFNSGVELLTGEHVIIDAQLRSWIEDDSSFITVAKIRVMAWSPAAPKRKRFSAVVHLTVFGYAAPSEDDTEG